MLQQWNILFHLNWWLSFGQVVLIIQANEQKTWAEELK